jgi:hypothetical protein
VVEAYVPIIKKHKDDAYTAEQKQWQQVHTSIGGGGCCCYGEWYSCKGRALLVEKAPCCWYSRLVHNACGHHPASADPALHHPLPHSCRSADPALHHPYPTPADPLTRHYTTPLPHSCRSADPALHHPLPHSCRSGVASTPSSTWCTTAAQLSASRRAAALRVSS